LFLWGQTENKPYIDDEVMTSGTFEKTTAKFLKERKPFFFIINFDKSQCYAYSFDEVLHHQILFDINGITNCTQKNKTEGPSIRALTIEPFSFKSYLQSFENVLQHLKAGNSFLVNIVDLIRNDLSIVAKNVTVTKYRYLEKIKTQRGEILQSSSEIKGKLKRGWEKDFGKLLLNMLPAGSISGAPKAKTLEIISASENYERGFYTGIFGVFDGENIDSGVAIRFIEKENDIFWYKSGGGITHQSNVKEEYIELINKIYIPTI